MIVDRSHWKWFFVTLALLAGAAWAYVAYARATPGGPTGGSLPGLVFGVIASLLMLFCGLIDIRKKLPRWRIGSAQSWLRAHIWLGLLSGPLVLFHAGFHWGGPLELALLLILAGIFVSGIFGLVMQRMLTRTLTTQVPLETFYDQIPHVCRVMQLEGDALVAAIAGPLPIEPLEAIATKERLEKLGVAGREPIWVVYEDSRQQVAGGGQKKSRQAAATQRVPGQQKEKEVSAPAVAVAKKLSPAEKIAMMKSGGGSAPVEGSTPVVAEAKELSAAEKIAMMKGKASDGQPIPPATTSEATPATTASTTTEPEAKKLSAAEKIALMKAGKSASATAPSAAASPSPESPAPSPSPPKALSAAEKIAMMKAGAKGKQQEPPAATTQASPAVEAPIAVAPEAKKLSAAEKIAMMKAGKSSRATATSADPAPPSPSPEASAPSSAPPKALSAAEKIAMMKTGKKPADSSSSDSPTPDPRPLPPTPSPQKITRPKTTLDKQSFQAAAAELRRFYLNDVRPFLDPRFAKRHPLASASTAEGIFAAARNSLPNEWSDSLGRLAALCDERRMLAVQTRIYRWLHGWRAVHMPLSFALLALGVVHVVASLYW